MPSFLFFIIVLVIVLFVVVFVLVVFILIVSIFVIVHKNHPTFSISFCRL